MSTYEAVIGLEVHVELKTNSKMFTRAANKYGEPENTLTNPVVLALPGALPVMNREAIEKSVKVGLMLGCQIAEVCKWDRKNYFYPDLPKNYQISQYDKPLCLGGYVEIELPGPARNIQGEHKKIKLTRIHLEEDVGKSTHIDTESLLDFNRAGVPLIEIVSEPDMHTPEEAFAYLTALRMHLLYAGISDCDMEKGQLRCDANISVRPVGQTTLGTKVELKNLNSISGVKNGLEFEIKRQIQCVEKGEKIPQETRRWDAFKNATYSMRSKEQAHDYRYFPDPDLMPVRIPAEVKKRLGDQLPELPWQKQERYQKELGLPYTQTAVLVPDQELCEYFEKAVAAYSPNPQEAAAHAKAIGNFVTNDILRERAAAVPEGMLPLSEVKIKPEQIAELVKIIDAGGVSSQNAKAVFIEMFKTGASPAKIIEKRGFKVSSDMGAIEKLVREAIEKNPEAVAQFKGGKLGAINVVKGYVMKQSKGSASPAVIDELLKKILG
jgi:aspartyl-tRNA(Asn)/glutamyl-tRNA(Gln) amidotransferase subunit B